MTTAETVLLEQQSILQFIEKLADDTVQVVVSISNQSISSISAKMGMNPFVLSRKLCKAFKSRGVHAVFDLSVASRIALLENYLEFQRRISNNVDLPMMASSCPGWICYVEKSQPHLLRHISSVKSPQAIMGTLIKQFWCSNKIGTHEGIFHVTVMPCYDKKLESVREELMIDYMPEIDCVLTTTELEKWLIESNIELSKESEIELDILLSDCYRGNAQNDGIEEAFLTFGNSDSIESDGYMSFIYRKICAQSGIDIPGNCVPIKHGRNTDIRESNLSLPSGRQLQFGIVNGFRNIQGLVRKIKSNKCGYDYVEVMACPSGCINGGGQIPVGSENRNTNTRMKDSLVLLANNPTQLANSILQCCLVYKHWIQDSPGSKNALQRFSTTYKERKSIGAGSVVDW